MKDTLPPVGETGPDQSVRPDAPYPIPYTQVHTRVRRTLENLQDVIVSLVMVMLLVLSLQALWRIARMALTQSAATTQLLSEIIFVLILTELYRLLISYLRDHRISVALTIEVALVSTLREVMLKGAHEHDFEWHSPPGAQRVTGRSGRTLSPGTLDGALPEREVRNRCPLTTRSSASCFRGIVPNRLNRG